MKNIRRYSLLLVLLSAMGVRAEEKKLDLDKAKNTLEKLAGEAKKELSKHMDSKPDSLWPRSKETLALPKEEYLKRVESAMKMMDGEIKALAEAEGAVNARDYFKTHIESLKQHHAYCKQDIVKLAGTDGEEAFRVKQKKFDRVLGFLAGNIQLAKEEAGL